MRQARENVAHVVHGFANGGNSVGVIHARRTGVVGCQCLGDIAGVAREQLFEQFGATLDILPGIERVGDAEFRAASGHQLHQSSAPLAETAQGRAADSWWMMPRSNSGFRPSRLAASSINPLSSFSGSGSQSGGAP